MSKLATARGDDHPEAAEKHLQDASTLLNAGRADGAAYLSGYVVECSLKSLLQLQTGKQQEGHQIIQLAQQFATLAAVAGSKTARYLGPTTAGLATSAIRVWHPTMRYQAPSVTLAEASEWHVVADGVYQETIAQMLLDGEL